MASNRILTTHVGSLVRPPKLIEFLRKIEDRQPYDQVAYEACLKESIEEVVRQQADAGIDIALTQSLRTFDGQPGFTLAQGQ